MHLKMEWKPGDVLLLKVLVCILIGVLSLNFFLLPDISRHSELTARKEELKAEKEQAEDEIAAISSREEEVSEQQKSLLELSADYYPQMDNTKVDQLVTGIVLAHQLFPVSLTIGDAVPGIPAAFTGTVTEDTKVTEEVTNIGEDTGTEEEDSVTEDTGLLVNEPYVSDIQYMNTVQVTVNLQGTEEQLRAFLDDISKHYPAIQVRSMQATAQTYVDTDLQAVQQLDITCTLAIYTCGDKNYEEVTTGANES